MALNLDDLIGSMQHSFHAGDRGTDLNEIRENLKLTLGQQALGPGQTDGGQSSRRSYSPRQWDARTHAPYHSSLDGDMAMLSGSVENSAWRQAWPNHSQQQTNSSYGRSPMSLSSENAGFNTQSSPPIGFGGPGSLGSQGSSTSSFGFGGFAQAPANTPQQTPVETSALARQLQAELERARDQQGNSRIAEADERFEADWAAQQLRQSASLSPPNQFASDAHASSPGGYSHQLSMVGIGADHASVTPRKLVNGFELSSAGGAQQAKRFASPPGGGRSIGAGL
ncbi:hypothetical protein ACQY0O_006685 [Thecaphora frezii]